MEASERCLVLIRHFEGLRLEAYRCPAGVWTIGYGRTRGVSEGMTISTAKADEFLREDVASTEAELRTMLPGVQFTQGQWDALVSLAYNVGASRLPTVAPRFWKSLYAGDKSAAVVELCGINRAGGKVLPGLTARRKAEAELFLS
ncbi:MAG: lysozyme [Bryobacteraceae bacterium]